MTFLWPEVLWLLLTVPALIGAYILLLRRKKKVALKYSSLSLIHPALDQRHRFLAHIPPLLFLLALVASVIAIARPAAFVTLPTQQQTIILAIDVSLSMGARDVDPDRMTAAQIAAKTFVEERPRNTLVGIVAFGGSAQLVQVPTLDREALVAAIERFQLQRATATGSALYVALAALLPDAGIDMEPLIFNREISRSPEGGMRLGASLGATRQDSPKAVAAGSYTSGAVILMSDGQRTTGPDPIDAANLAARYGVRVFTVGFGSAEGTLVNAGGWLVHVRLDEETLKSVADITRGRYFHAGTAEDLRKVYQDLNARLVSERQNTEITSLWTAAAGALLLASLLLSLRWSSRIL